uniref:Large ribosomal subunit protein uL1c n=1 Tax=Noccaea caerulescens TaxID=107243 RepID=A0A1J3CLY7_NOCCA
MAAMKLLLSQARRQGLTKSFSSPFQQIPRLFSSSSPSDSNPSPDSNPELNPPQNESRRKLEPVSYAAKPKDQKSEPSDGASPPPSSTTLLHSESASQEDQSSLTREEIRYVKDAPSISPVSYAQRVAPLPEDRVVGEDERERTPEEMEIERKRIEAENRARRRFLRATAVEEDTSSLPLPTLLKPDLRHGKKPIFDLTEAIREIKSNAKAKFDETLEAHVRLGIEKGRSELIVRGTLALPHSVKKDVKVAFFAEGTDAEDAKAAGADVVGGLELIEEILKSGKIDFDRCLATPKMMPRVYKISRILNNHGLMPNPKQGSVTKDVTKAVKDAKAGHTKFRMDKTSILHVPLGKMSFPEDALRENVGAFMNALLLAKPAGLKKTSKYAGYVNAFHLCSTMGKGYPVSIQSLSRAADLYTKLQLK